MAVKSTCPGTATDIVALSLPAFFAGRRTCALTALPDDRDGQANVGG
jgi:hypothetical protein